MYKEEQSLERSEALDHKNCIAENKTGFAFRRRALTPKVDKEI